MPRIAGQNSLSTLCVFAAGAFGIGEPELVIMGLLVEVSADLRLSVTGARSLISRYAISEVFDRLIDFDLLLRDAAHPERFAPAFDAALIIILPTKEMTRSRTPSV